MKRHPANPLIKPEMVPPSREGCRVKGTFNPGAVQHNGEIVLLPMVAEGCVPRKDYISVPYRGTHFGDSKRSEAEPHR